MDKSDFQVDPEAASYYNRLDVDASADTETIRRAGMVALRQYDRETAFFLEVRQAFDVLTNGDLRNVYDRFCEELGVELGTRAFETWQDKGERDSQIERIINEFEKITNEPHNPRQGDEWNPEVGAALRNQLEIGNPKIDWSSPETPESVSVNQWDVVGERLYINNFHPRGDIYLALTTGVFFTENDDIVSDVRFEVLSGGEALYIKHKKRGIRIHLRADAGPSFVEDLWNQIELDTPRILWDECEFIIKDEVSLQVDQQNHTIMIKNHHLYNDVHLDLDTGVFYKGDRTLLQDMSYSVADNGRRLVMKHDLKRGVRTKIVIDLVGTRREKEEDPEKSNDVGEKPWLRRTRLKIGRNIRKRWRTLLDFLEFFEPIYSVVGKTEGEPWLQTKRQEIRPKIGQRSTLLLSVFDLAYSIIKLVIVPIAAAAAFLSAISAFGLGLGAVLIFITDLYTGDTARGNSALAISFASVFSYILFLICLNILGQFNPEMYEHPTVDRIIP